MGTRALVTRVLICGEVEISVDLFLGATSITVLAQTIGFSLGVHV